MPSSQPIIEVILIGQSDGFWLRSVINVFHLNFLHTVQLRCAFKKYFALFGNLLFGILTSFFFSLKMLYVAKIQLNLLLTAIRLSWQFSSCNEEIIKIPSGMYCCYTFEVSTFNSEIVYHNQFFQFQLIFIFSIDDHAMYMVF